MWVARDEDNQLWGYTNKPIKQDTYHRFIDNGGNYIQLNDDDFIDVSYENSPQKVTGSDSKTICALSNLLEKINEQLELECKELLEYTDNSSDIQEQTYLYHKGRESAFFNVQIIVSSMIAAESQKLVENE